MLREKKNRLLLGLEVSVFSVSFVFFVSDARDKDLEGVPDMSNVLLEEDSSSDRSERSEHERPSLLRKMSTQVRTWFVLVDHLSHAARYTGEKFAGIPISRIDVSWRRRISFSI